MGDRLKRAREKRRLSLTEVEEQTKVRAKYLAALERGQYFALPKGAYSRGFLLTYATFLGFTEAKILDDWQREATLQDVAPEKPRFKAEKNYHYMRFFITPRLLLFGLAIIIGISVLSFILYQVRHLTDAPELLVNLPLDRTVVQSDSIMVTGKTEDGAKVAINEQPVTLSGDGKFSEKVQLKPGMNTITISAKNKSGREALSTLLIESKITKTEETPVIAPTP